MPEPAGPAAQSVSQNTASAEGRFRIDLPDLGNGNGNEPRTDFSWFVFNLGQYHVSYFDGPQVVDAPEVSETILNKLRDMALSKRPSGRVEVDSAINLSGHPGRELRISDNTGTQIDRIYLAGNRIYIASVFVSKRMDCKLGSAVKILDTFEITE